MALTIKQVAEAALCLEVLVKKDSETPFLPYSTKLKIATLNRKIKADYDKFVNERMALVQKYGSPVHKDPMDEKSEIVGFKVADSSPKKAEFDKLFGELLADEAELDAIKPLPAESLGECPLPEPVIRELQDKGVVSIPVDE